LLSIRKPFIVNFELCESSAPCAGVCPEVFEVRDDDLLHVVNENPREELRAKVEQAARVCPKQAIAIED
jgi:ferredoxin